MAHPARVATAEPKPAQRYRRRHLRIGIRQLERAELYIAAVATLDLEDETVESAVDRLLDDLESLRQHLLRLKTRS